MPVTPAHHPIVPHAALCPPSPARAITSELGARAQEFRQSLRSALEELAAALHNTEADPDTLASVIAARFSSASSNQAKLLRVLKTINYMYSPKTPGNTSDANIEKVQNVHESFNFLSLWQRLGGCVSIIGDSTPEMEHSTLRLPCYCSSNGGLPADEFSVTKLVGNKKFVQLSANYHLNSSIKDRIEALLAGFYEIIPKDLITISPHLLRRYLHMILIHECRERRTVFYNHLLHTVSYNDEGTLADRIDYVIVHPDLYSHVEASISHLPEVKDLIDVYRALARAAPSYGVIIGYNKKTLAPKSEEKKVDQIANEAYQADEDTDISTPDPEEEAIKWGQTSVEESTASLVSSRPDLPYSEIESFDLLPELNHLELSTINE
ncbi:hypothetical protein C8Q70DRAFT_1059032 [Cubamyces menziesii]|nr:hypothetical protein C8Q70DRAFT_1059032 [Cubamyces menziesii]